MAEPIYTLFSVGLRERPRLAQENKQGTFNQLFSLSVPLSSNPRAHSPSYSARISQDLLLLSEQPQESISYSLSLSPISGPACSTTYTLNSLFLYLPFPQQTSRGFCVGVHTQLLLKKWDRIFASCLLHVSDFWGGIGGIWTFFKSQMTLKSRQLRCNLLSTHQWFPLQMCPPLPGLVWKYLLWQVPRARTAG